VCVRTVLVCVRTTTGAKLGLFNLFQSNNSFVINHIHNICIVLQGVQVTDGAHIMAHQSR